MFVSVGFPTPVVSDPTGVSFCWWYHDSGCGAGGPNPYEKLVYLDAASNPTTLRLVQGASGTYTYSNQNFFPIDGLGWNAGTNPQIDFGTPPPMPPNFTCAGAVDRNFAFTSELHYLFTYQAGSATPAVFNFTGDDSVWAFINNQLVIDLGGVHSPRNGTVTLDQATVAALGLNLVNGGWYSIDLFQAEQHVCLSTYALTLSNFAHVITQCQTVCGDGIVAGNEQCDNGTANNVGGYGMCNPNCTLAPYCGDAIVQNPPEQCDDGANLATYGGLAKSCGPGCKLAPYCGDGVLSNGEQCDEGANNGTGYGHCSAACTLGPRCGDSIVQSPPEQCDDGINNGSTADKCSASCTLKCGNGVVEAGEQCDNGAANNTGGYGKCNPDCTLAPRCGDAVVQNPPEQCDNGVNDGSYGTCKPDCTLAPYCGDGLVQNPPEKCDNGANNVPVAGAYGSGPGLCTQACVPAPYCGDGIVQTQFGEQCDSTVNCTAKCMPGPTM